MKTPRANRWAVAALVERDSRTKSEIARDASTTPSALGDILSGRRDASEELLGRLAAAFDVDPRAVSADPYGLVEALAKVADVARALEPHVNGPLTEALQALDGVTA